MSWWTVKRTFTVAAVAGLLAVAIAHLVGCSVEPSFGEVTSSTESWQQEERRTDHANHALTSNDFDLSMTLDPSSPSGAATGAFGVKLAVMRLDSLVTPAMATSLLNVTVNAIRVNTVTGDYVDTTDTADLYFMDRGTILKHVTVQQGWPMYVDFNWFTVQGSSSRVITIKAGIPNGLPAGEALMVRFYVPYATVRHENGAIGGARIIGVPFDSNLVTLEAGP